ncbi:PQQ-dependent sugar dehydrogenase [Pedosphaera parvula]|uniref:Secreted glycosyl hydrolase n=1 Tax=Pedosphaera parvula (strain Ellin514) TaxID=320771 RepID=B9XCI3_PEDPL|nr:PQQ-dependent sugar dehydrogenase [Pedosphaera parvula]EEF62651.1 secreted glycosyl hydrolase [Pedosphaera parvula Ellin514]
MKNPVLKLLSLTFCTSAFLASSQAGDAPLPSGPQSDGAFKKVILDADKDVEGNGKIIDSVKDPMELAVAGDGRVFYAQRDGTVKMYQPETKATIVIGKLEVEDYIKLHLEDGLLGVTLDPNFLKNNWIYLYYSPPETKTDKNGEKAGENILSRFTLKDNKLDMASEKVMLRVATQREQCCHSGGSLAFDSKGNLYLSTGDNTNPFASDGFSPSDERPGRSPWDAQKSAANANDLRGKVLRITPQPDGSVKIPKGNLFKPGTMGTRPEIFAMGCRNPFRISIDQKTGFLYWGDVGPDAQTFKEGRGPAGMDEFNQARSAGFFGWPYFLGENKAYWKHDFEKQTSGERFDVAKPVNNSPNNTGIKELPPAQPAFISYTYGPSAKFPALGSGGRTAMAGPVYYYDPKLKSEHKLPREFDHTLFLYEWSRNWILAVHLDEKDNIAKMEQFCPHMTFKRPMDMELGPDGCLYLIEYGTAWENNLDSQIVRIEYTGEPKEPLAQKKQD